MEKKEFRLLPFQFKAVEQTVEALHSYDGDKNLFTRGSSIPDFLEGEPKPYLHRIKAITGAGKTPILASVASSLKNSIILWTTPRGAIIEQTTANLKGKYNTLLGSDTEVLSLDEVITNANWNRLIEKETGCTIITTTVARFNQQDDKNLNLLKGDPSPWDQLCHEVKRPVWVFYDEGHNATKNQFCKLLELQPRGFILASASPLSHDLEILLPGEDKKAKENVLNSERTTIVDTKEVVKSGLLKQTIEINDLQTGENTILEEAYKKRASLASLVDEQVIACYMVDKNSDGTGVIHGLHIWQKLVSLGVDPKTIAVHLQGAKKLAEIEAKNGKPQFCELVPTYDEHFTPDDLKQHGFKHLIWNLSLEEGWDEPWAYVGYFHGKQSSEKKVTQRIGRLIRNPHKNIEGVPCSAPEMPPRSVYCFLNAEDSVVSSVVDRLKAEMNTSSLEVIVHKSVRPDKQSTIVEPKITKMIPNLYLSVDPEKIQRELCDSLFSQRIAKADYKAKGVATTTRVKIADAYSPFTRKKKLNKNAPVVVADAVKSFLEQGDSRLVRRKGSIGPWISPTFWRKPELLQELFYTSSAYFTYKKRCEEFVTKMDRLVSLTEDNDRDSAFIVGDSVLTNPNGGATPAQEARYKVHRFENAVHEAYNGFNPFELELARSLDEKGVTWFRNPSRSGYGIPLTTPDGSSTMFYPDFIAWKGREIYFIEAKGAHLVELTKKEKLKKLPGRFNLGVITQEKQCYRLLRQGNRHIHEETGTLDELLSILLNI